jgi:transcriptional regulator with XRE-family HTH domain
MKALSEQLREAILKAGVTRYEISKATGVSEPTLSKFVLGQRGLSFDAMDRVGLYLGLTITSRPRRPGKKKE